MPSSAPVLAYFRVYLPNQLRTGYSREHRTRATVPRWAQYCALSSWMMDRPIRYTPWQHFRFLRHIFHSSIEDEKGFEYPLDSTPITRVATISIQRMGFIGLLDPALAHRFYTKLYSGRGITETQAQYDKCVYGSFLHRIGKHKRGQRLLEIERSFSHISRDIPGVKEQNVCSFHSRPLFPGVLSRLLNRLRNSSMKPRKTMMQ